MFASRYRPTWAKCSQTPGFTPDRPAQGTVIVIGSTESCSVSGLGVGAPISTVAGAVAVRPREPRRSVSSHSAESSALRCRVPNLATRLLAHACDLLHATPLSFGHWELLRHDNAPRVNHLPGLLGRAPREVGCTRDPGIAVPAHGSPA